MSYQPVEEDLQNFANYVKTKPPGEQITVAELAKLLPSKSKGGARRLLNYLTQMGVIEQRGGYRLSEGCESVLLDLIQYGPVLYPRTPEEPLKIYGRVEDVPPIIIDAYGCRIQALPSQRTIPESKRQIVQGNTFIIPPIELDGVNKWILERFFEDMLDGNFELHENGLVTPVDGFYVFSAANVARNSAKPVATLAYFSGDSLDNLRETAESLIRYGESNLPLNKESFDEECRKTVRLVQENSGRIENELISKLMEIWCPELVTEVHETKVEVPHDKRRSIFNPLTLFRH